VLGELGDGQAVDILVDILNRTTLSAYDESTNMISGYAGKFYRHYPPDSRLRNAAADALLNIYRCGQMSESQKLAVLKLEGLLISYHYDESTYKDCAKHTDRPESRFEYDHRGRIRIWDLASFHEAGIPGLVRGSCHSVRVTPSMVTSSSSVCFS